LLEKLGEASTPRNPESFFRNLKLVPPPTTYTTVKAKF